MVKNYLVFIIFVFGVPNLGAQELTLKKMIDATGCCDERCFYSTIKEAGICYKRTRSDSIGTFYRHQNCGADSATTKRIIVHFAVLTNGQYNSSFLTWNEQYMLSLKKELKKYKFRKIENPDDPAPNRVWYHSEKYPHMNIMWEELVNDKNEKRWHIGLVWA